jgi:hypothetical protein
MTRRDRTSKGQGGHTIPHRSRWHKVHWDRMVAAMGSLNGCRKAIHGHGSERRAGLRLFEAALTEPLSPSDAFSVRTHVLAFRHQLPFVKHCGGSIENRSCSVAPACAARAPIGQEFSRSPLARCLSFHLHIFEHPLVYVFHVQPYRACDLSSVGCSQVVLPRNPCGWFSIPLALTWGRQRRCAATRSG